MNYSEQVKNIMTKDLVTVFTDTPILKLKNMFKSKNIHHVLVENDAGVLQGIISTADLERIAHFPVREDQLIAEHVMTTNPERNRPEMELRHVVDYFLDNRFRAIPIVDKEDKLLGIVTPYDIMEALMIDFEEEEEEETHFDNV